MLTKLEPDKRCANPGNDTSSFICNYAVLLPDAVHYGQSIRGSPIELGFVVHQWHVHRWLLTVYLGLGQRATVCVTSLIRDKSWPWATSGCYECQWMHFCNINEEMWVSLSWKSKLPISKLPWRRACRIQNNPLKSIRLEQLSCNRSYKYANQHWDSLQGFSLPNQTTASAL